MCTGFWWGNLRERDHLDGADIDGSIILKWIVWQSDRGAWTGLIWLIIGQVRGSCECGNEPSGSIQCREFLDQLRTF